MRTSIQGARHNGDPVFYDLEGGHSPFVPVMREMVFKAMHRKPHPSGGWTPVWRTLKRIVVPLCWSRAQIDHWIIRAKMEYACES